MVGMAIGLYATIGLLAGSGAMQYIDFDSGWTHESKGPWQTRVDHRGLLAMHHPWVPSGQGNLAMSWKDVAIPDDWTGDVALTFYQSDDYHTNPADPAGAALPAEGFVGHRRKQILVNNLPVWNEDVSDPVRPGTSLYIHVPIKLAPDQRRFRIALVAFDNEASTVQTRHDYYRPPTPEMTREKDPDAGRFRTTIYWGDLALVHGDAEYAARPRPSERLVLERHNEHWPRKAETKRWAGKSFDLQISAPGGIPESGFPLEMGLPLPRGVAQSRRDFRLRVGGAGIHVAKSVGATWQDESLRWAQVRFPVKPGMNSVALSFGEDTARAPSQIAIREGDAGIIVDGGAVSWSSASGIPLSRIALNKKGIVENLRLSLEVSGEVVPGTNQGWHVVESESTYACVALDGRFDGQSESFGSYTLYVSSYQGLPCLKLWLRYFNDTARKIDLSHFRMEFELSDPPTEVNLPHGTVKGDFTLVQNDAARYRIGESDIAVDRPVFVQWKDGALASKNFRELFPKGISRYGGNLALDLCAGANSPVGITPGEASSHEVWLALGKQDGAALAKVVEQPPILQNPEYWCATGVLGPAAPLPKEHPLAAHLEVTCAEKDWVALGQSLGMRHFTDGPYLGRAGEWANDYDGRMLGLWYLWAMTGDRAWFDRAAATSAHLMDVAIVHSEIPERDWMGALHGPGANHVAGPWMPALQADGLALYGQLTGNAEAQIDFLGVADFCVRTGAGLQGVSVRHYGAPFANLCAAYLETGEVAFLEAGAARLEAMYKRMDRRRGAWIDWHGSEVYPGTTPWMAAQLAGPLYAWYDRTGDVEAAQLLVGLAETIICENTPWDRPGAMRTYSPNPRFPETTAYDPFVLPLLLAAHELTGDAFFLDAAEAQWTRWQAAPTYLPVFNLAWHWPWVNTKLSVENGQATLK
ncbi:MAG: hypothetical protein JNK74_16180 [Candidatus Hydrogenedentes bacterium]|nr:hypothetical protein [Candidatus Hydrogenedentota bacterium]